jgi:hypothetical protein
MEKCIILMPCWVVPAGQGRKTKFIIARLFGCNGKAFSSTMPPVVFGGIVEMGRSCSRSKYDSFEDDRIVTPFRWYSRHHNAAVLSSAASWRWL